MWSSFRRRRFTDARPVAVAIAALAMACGLACTEVHVEETLVNWSTPACGANNNGGGRNNGGGSSQPAQPSNAVMDTYMVQIFELNDPTAVVGGTECQTCIATRKNCFIETSSCVCGDATAVDSDHMQQMLKGVHLGLPSSYKSQYCMRVMAVQRASQSESANCECDSTWEQPDRVRLCALSNPYAASSVPVEMAVQCSLNTDKFSSCLDQ